MSGKVNQVLWNQWRQRVKRQRESGLSIAEFCRREKVSAHSFHAWKRKLRQPGAARRASRQPAGVPRSGSRRAVGPPRRESGHTLAGSTHALAGSTQAGPGPEVPPGFLELPVAAVRPGPFIEVALADGTLVRLPQQNVAALVAMLRVLRGDRGELSGEEGCHA